MMSIDKQSHAYWIQYARKTRKLIVFNGQDVLDLTQFAKVHIAGEKAIITYIYQDIKNILFRIYPHPPTALQTLSKFCCGKVKDYKNAQNPKSKGICKQKSTLLTKQQNSKKVCFEVNKQKMKVLQTGKKQKKIKNSKRQQIKIEQNSTVFEQNKPVLMVPQFNVKFDSFTKNKMMFEAKQQDII